MANLNLLNDASIKVIRELVATEIGRRDNSQLHNPSDIAPIQSPDVYIAYTDTPIDGTDPVTKKPTKADCQIYRYDLNTQKLEKVSDYKKTIVNYSTSSVDKGYFCVLRDKFGVWIPTIPGSQGDFLFKLFNVDCHDLTAMGHPVRGPKGATLPPDPQQIVDGVDSEGVPQSLECWLAGGNAAILEGQLAWCEEINPDPYNPNVRLWAIKIMCGAGANCA